MERIFQRINKLVNGPEISIFHQFHKPPYGGGNQFLLALEGELKRQGHSVGRNKIGKNTAICLFNSYNFNFDQLSKLRQKFKPRMIHRVDGPISIYRGTSKEIDNKIWQSNHDLADATIFQSQYSLNKHKELGLEFKNPTVIPNASDPAIFNREGRVAPPTGTRKVKLIATAWSDNPKKGGPLLEWLDKYLDHARYELIFVGRTQAKFKGAKVIAPVPSKDLAQILRQHDIYIAASQDDPCSNALIEALACGLPAVYLRSGGHGELVGNGGERFSNNDEMLKSIDLVADNWQMYHDAIKVRPLSEVALQYMKIMELT